jgi:hypothetical protein
MINRRVVMIVLGELARARQSAVIAKAERVSTSWANRLGRFAVTW